MEETHLDKKVDWKKNVALFLAGQTISLFGSSLVQYAIMWYITLNTKSGIMLTISIICGFLPTFFLSPFAGVWADRYNRKMLIILSDSMIALVTLVLAILFFMGYDAMWLLFLASAVRALGGSIQTPAVNAFIPQFVPEDKLLRVNAVNGTIQSITMLVSPMLSGALLTFASIEAIFFIDVVTAALAIFTVLFFVNVPAHERALTKQSVSYFHDLGEGVRYIKNHKFIKVYYLFFAVFYIFVSPVAFLTPLQVARSFGDEVWRLTAIEISFAVGMILGGITMSAWGGLKNKIYTIAFTILIFGITTIALGIVPVFWLYIVFMVISGVAIPGFNTPSIALLQQKVEGDYQGRAFGVLGMIQSAMMPISILVFGPLADIIAIEWMLIGTGIIMSLMALILTNNKVLVEAGKPEPEL
ncbi:MAG: MFS transporter [Clostridiaceae bacterium]|nr:MFS transporter [Clostridiaceae bacterium]